jgi:Uma2 family endonuclease
MTTDRSPEGEGREETIVMNGLDVEDDKLSVRKHRLTVADFHKMGEAGIFSEDARVELIEGELFDMPPIGSGHASVVMIFIHLFTRAVGDLAIVGAQTPIILGEESEPQPDIVLLKPRNNFYASSHPTPEDVLLLIEVADSSTRYDRSIKIPLYARYCIPEVWLIDLPHKRLEVYRHPKPEYAVYERLEQYYEGSVSPQLLPNVAINVADLFRF